MGESPPSPSLSLSAVDLPKYIQPQKNKGLFFCGATLWMASTASYAMMASLPLLLPTALPCHACGD